LLQGKLACMTNQIDPPPSLMVDIRQSWRGGVCL